MEAPLSPSKLKRRLPLSETDCNGIPPSKRSYPRISAQASDQTSELSDSDCSTPKNGDLPGANLPDEPETFYGLPMSVKELLKKHRKIDDLYDWQSRLMDRLVDSNKNIIYSVPTSGGKTLVAELMLIRELLVHKRNALLVLPYVSIVQEKLKSMYPFAEKLGFMIEEFAGSKGHMPLKMRRNKKTLYIATIEKANLVVMSLLEMKKFNLLGMVVIDELHMIGDGTGRGATLESLIMKCKIAAFKHNPTFRMLGMSATLSNFDDLAKFMEAEVVKDKFRPVELKEYIKLERDLYDATTVTTRKICYKDMPRVKQYPDNPSDCDGLDSLVSEVIPEKSCLVFCSTKKHCENVASFLTTAFLKTKRLRCHRTKEKDQAIAEIQRSNEGSICPVLLRTIPSGIAYHHSGLTPDEREVIESSFLKGIISCIVCTSTLAAGVNLPAERVIIREPYVGREFLTKSQYQQMCGRAGRAGMSESGQSILMVARKDHEKVKNLIESPVPSCSGSLLERLNDFAALLLNFLHAQLATNLDDLRQITEENSFSALQYKPSEVKDILAKVIERLFHRKLIEKIDNDIVVTPDGRAIVKSLIGVDRCSEIHDHLKQAANHLNVQNHLHLIFVSTSLFAEAELPIEIDTWLLFEAYMDLDEEEKESANVIGFAPSIIARARDTGRADTELKRFFITLMVHDAYEHRLDLDTLSRRYGIQRGNVYSLLNQVASHASNLFRFVEEKKENFWAFEKLLPDMCMRLTYCCTPELVPLMQLPGVKLPRAKQLLSAGYKDIKSIAKCKDRELIGQIDKLNLNQARRIIKAARYLVMGIQEELKEELESMALNESNDVLDVSNSVIDDPFTLH